MERITERSLYEPLMHHLRTIHAEGVQEPEVGGLYPDLSFSMDHSKFILQVKIGQPHAKLTEGLSDAYQHGQLAGTDNIIVLVYPPETRRPIVGSIDQIALDSKVSGLILTKYWRGPITQTARSMLDELNQRATKGEAIPSSLDFVVQSIGDAVDSLGETLRGLSKARLREAIDNVVGRFDLFLMLAKPKGAQDEKLHLASIDLLSYLLVNQILFYHIYASVSKSAGSKPVDPLPTGLKTLGELSKYFDQITDINFRSIYAVEVARRLPDARQVVERINQILKAIKLVAPETIRHDLLGRMFHDSLPRETRKTLAAFYTKPQAAEILAILAISDLDAKVMDPACGSGTLAVASYRRKLSLWKDTLPAEPDLERIRQVHKTFVENQITCIDVMPFATHLTAVNLSSQTVVAATDSLRVAVMDALDLSQGDPRHGIEVKPFTTHVQKTLTEELGEDLRFSRGAVSAEGPGRSFRVTSVDCVIMNPPFSDRKNLPQDYREKLLTESKLTKVCGSSLNLWGYFLALAHHLLRNDGTVAAVVPANLLRGKSTQQLRDFLVQKYRWRYLITSLKDVAFSESAVYRDILLVADRSNPSPNDWTAIVFLKKTMSGMLIEEAHSLAESIAGMKPPTTHETQDFILKWVNAETLSAYHRNLMFLIRMAEEQGKEALDDFLRRVQSHESESLVRISASRMIRGFEQSPRGLPQMCFIARPIAEARLKRAFLILKREGETLEVMIKGLGKTLHVPAKSVLAALRSPTNITRFDISDMHDFIIQAPYPEWGAVVPLTGWKGSFDWGTVRNKLKDRLGNLFIATRFRPTSANTHLLAFSADKPFATTNKFTRIIVESDEEAKIQCLMLNSVVALAYMITYMNSATGGFIELKHYDLSLFPIFNMKKLPKDAKDTLLSTYHSLRHVDFPSLMEQLREPSAKRVKLDTGVLRASGFSQNETHSLLPQLYRSVHDELIRLKQSERRQKRDEE